MADAGVAYQATSQSNQVGHPVAGREFVISWQVDAAGDADRVPHTSFNGTKI